MTQKLSGAARRRLDSRIHVIEDIRTRLKEGGGFVRCSCSELIERTVSTLYGEDPFEPLHEAFMTHRRATGAGEPRPVRDRTGARFDRAIA